MNNHSAVRTLFSNVSDSIIRRKNKIPKGKIPHNALEAAKPPSESVRLDSTGLLCIPKDSLIIREVVSESPLTLHVVEDQLNAIRIVYDYAWAVALTVVPERSGIFEYPPAMREDVASAMLRLSSGPSFLLYDFFKYIQINGHTDKIREAAAAKIELTTKEFGL